MVKFRCQSIDFGYNELHRAIIHNDANVVARVIENDCTVLQTRDTLGFTPLHVAALLGRIELLKIILDKLDKSGNLEIMSKKKEKFPLPLLHVAALRNNDFQTMLSVLKTYIVCVNQTNRHGQTALHLAAKNGNVACLIELLTAGCDRKIIDRKGMKAYDTAIEHKRTRCANILSSPLRSSSPLDLAYSSDEFDSGIAVESIISYKSHQHILRDDEDALVIRSGYADDFPDENNNEEVCISTPIKAKLLKNGDDPGYEMLQTTCELKNEGATKHEDAIIIEDDDRHDSMSSSSPDLVCTYIRQDPFSVVFSSESSVTTQVQSISSPTTLHYIKPVHKLLSQGIEALSNSDFESEEMQLIASQPDLLAYIIIRMSSLINTSSSLNVTKMFLASCRAQNGDLTGVVSTLLQLTGLIKTEGVPSRHEFEKVCPRIIELVLADIFILNETRMIGYFVSRNNLKSIKCLKLLETCYERDVSILSLSKDVDLLVHHWNISSNYFARAFPGHCADVIWDRMEPHLDRRNYTSFTVRLVEYLGLIKTEHCIHRSTSVEDDIKVLSILRQRNFFPPRSNIILNVFLSKQSCEQSQ